MVQTLAESDEKILARLREPIDEVINRYGYSFTDMNRMRLRQLAWFAVDVLIDKDDVADLANSDVIRHIIEDVKSLGASREFIRESLDLAKIIYNNLKLDHPDLIR